MSISSGEGPELIGHGDAQRRTLVLSNVREWDLGSFEKEVRERVADAGEAVRIGAVDRLRPVLISSPQGCRSPPP